MEYHVRIKSDKREPKEYKQHKLEAARREMGNKLYGILLSGKLPAVVDIEEIDLVESRYEMYPYDEIEIRTTVTPVQHKHVTMAHAPEITWQPIMRVGKHPVKRTLTKILNSIGRHLR